MRGGDGRLRQWRDLLVRGTFDYDGFRLPWRRGISSAMGLFVIQSEHGWAIRCDLKKSATPSFQL